MSKRQLHALRAAGIALMISATLSGCAGNIQAQGTAVTAVPVSTDTPASTSTPVSTASAKPTESPVSADESAESVSDAQTYASSSELTAPGSENAQENAISADENVQDVSSASDPMGTNGRLYFDDGISVALNAADPNDHAEIQWVTDQEDSAYIDSDGWTTGVFDHARQNFNKLDSYPIGYHMYIVDASGNRTDYTLTSKYYASWDAGTVTMDDGRDPWHGDTALFLQTCINAAGTRDVITYWTAE